MFYNFFNSFSVFNGFDINIVLIRTLFSFLFSFLFTVVGLKILINYLKSHQVFQPIRVEGPNGHLTTKQKTPTMAGIVMTASLLLSGILFCNITNIYIITVLFISISFAAIGLIDDIMKVFYKSTDGFKGSIKLLLEVAICGISVLWLIKNNSSITNLQEVFLPFFNVFLYLGVLYIPFVIVVIAGSTNGVNITDGLDGLVIVPVMLCAFGLGCLALSSGFGDKAFLFKTLNFDSVYELAILCSAVIGSGLGFLIYNRHPAKIFMGDVGSLMYGAFLGSTAVMLRYEVFFAIAGLLFVVESSSVILQVTSYKIFKKRIFKMAPIHHHFEKIGWSERKVVLSFWAFSFICLIIAVISII